MLGDSRWAAVAGAALLLLGGVSSTVALQNEAELLRLFEDLPETFVVEQESEIDALSSEGEERRIVRLRSARPLEEAEAGALYARVTLAAWRMVDAEAAKAEVRRQLEAADPDTGLTYAWDFVTSRDDSVLHLHADCTVSEEIFLLVSTRLREQVLVGGSHAEESFSCRCGGGCRAEAAEAPADPPPGLPRVRPRDPEWEEYDNRLDPSGTWESGIGRLSLMHFASGLSFTYLAVFGSTAHVCEGAGVAGLVGTDRYEYADEEGTIAFVISDRDVRLELTKGIAPFCGSGWPGDSFSIERFRLPTLCSVTAERAYFHVTDHLRPEPRAVFAARGDRLEAVPAELSLAEEMVLARFRRPQATTIGLLRRVDLACQSNDE